MQSQKWMVVCFIFLLYTAQMVMIIFDSTAFKCIYIPVATRGSQKMSIMILCDFFIQHFKMFLLFFATLYTLFVTRNVYCCDVCTEEIWPRQQSTCCRRVQTAAAVTSWVTRTMTSTKTMTSSSHTASHSCLYGVSKLRVNRLKLCCCADACQKSLLLASVQCWCCCNVSFYW